MGKTVNRLKKPEEFFPNPVPSTLVQEMCEALLEERTVVDIDLDAVRRGEDWSHLSGRIVGAE